MHTQTALATKHGYDGNPPLMREARDLDGRGKRKIEGTQNVNTDRLEWLFAHHHITQAQLEAGRRLEGDGQLAQIGGYTTFGSGGGRVVNLVPSNLADAKLDAMARINAARASIDGGSWRLLELVVLENVQLAEAGKRTFGHFRRGEGVTAIRHALDSLAKAYGPSWMGWMG